jgi:CelD/BcsL family acetyltransferase involved in cellulose biosynthesis
MYYGDKIMGSEWKFEWADSWDQVWDPAFLDKWRGLYAACPSAHVFASPAMVRTWQEFASEQMDILPRFLWGRHGSGATALLPLALVRSGWKQAGCRSLVAAGYDFDYQGPILQEADDPAVVTTFWREFLEQAECRCAHEIDEIAIRGLQRIPESSGLDFQEQCETAWIDLTEFANIEAFTASLAPGFRRELGRCGRRLEEIGSVSFKVLGPDEVDAALGTLEPFWRAYREHWNAWDGHRRYWEKLVTHCLPEGLLTFSTLACGDRQISWHLCFADKGTLYGWNAAFDREMAKYAPGALHMHRECDYCLAHGMKKYDFLRGSEEYKQRWPVKVSPLYRLRMANPALPSRARRTCRHVLDQLRPHVRRLRGGAGQSRAPTVGPT